MPSCHLIALPDWKSKKWNHHTDRHSKGCEPEVPHQLSAISVLRCLCKQLSHLTLRVASVSPSPSTSQVHFYLSLIPFVNHNWKSGVTWFWNFGETFLVDLKNANLYNTLNPFLTKFKISLVFGNYILTGCYIKYAHKIIAEKLI